MGIDPRYHIKVSPEQVGKYVITPGDRGRVERIAKYLDNPQRVVENREYLTYTGYLDGEKVSVISSGMGAPCMSILVEELATVGVHTIIRVGTTGALQRFLRLGDHIVAIGAVRQDGTTALYIDPAYPAVADLEVANALVEACKKLSTRYHVGVVLSTDAYYASNFADRETKRYIELMAKANVLTVEMETGCLFVVGRIRGIRTGAILTVREELTETGEYIQAGPRFEEGLENAIKAAVEAVKILIRKDREREK